MTDAAWETLSNQAVAAAGVVYFVALLCHLMEWAALRKVPIAKAEKQAQQAPERVLVGSAGEQLAPAEATPAVESDTRRTEFFGRLGVLLTIVAVGAHFIALLGRGMAADPNRVPWGNMYEFTLAGTFFVALIYLVAYKPFKIHWMAPLVLTFVVSVMMVAVIWLYKPVSPLMDALMSPWLVIHVVSAVIATGAFTVGGIASALYLVKERAELKGKVGDTGYLARLPDLKGLDRLSYRLHAFAFPVWTFAVLITGPIWAHEAWSRYWNWDPKEVWAFITWVVYAAYLHSRATAGWSGRNAAYLALLGMATLWFNFIGINYFSTSSMHSYAAPALSSVVESVGASAGESGAQPFTVAGVQR